MLCREGGCSWLPYEDISIGDGQAGFLAVAVGGIDERRQLADL
jgi:hypothetical protein